MTPLTIRQDFVLYEIFILIIEAMKYALSFVMLKATSSGGVIMPNN